MFVSSLVQLHSLTGETLPIWHQSFVEERRTLASDVVMFQLKKKQTIVIRLRTRQSVDL